MISDEHIVFIVDDDNRIREALCELLASHGIRAMAFGSAGAYVNSKKPDAPACLILDIELPDINGLDLQSEIAQGEHPPIVFITGHGDIRSSVRAIKDGAVDFLTKPFTDTDLMNAIHAAIAQDREKRAERAESGKLKRRYLDLTPREREVLPLVVSGLLNKQAAAELGISEVTLQIHRRNVMQKMAAASLADLVRIAERLEIPITHSRRAGGKPRVTKHRRVVAIVDDDLRLLESLEDLLESAGYLARSFSSAGSLLSSGLSGLDALITDIGMPGMDGFELRDFVKKMRPDLPVFLITGRHEIAEQHNAQDISGCFRKPFDAQVLLAALANALRDREMEGNYET
ncbi:FixJ family two-component response regulator [Ensifer sp. 4252]